MNRQADNRETPDGERRLRDSPGVEYVAGRAAGISAGALLAAGPRAARFLARSATRNLRFPDQRTRPEIPTRLPSWGTAAGVWLDELFLAYMATTRLSPNAGELDRIAAEVQEALTVLGAAGVLDDPTLLHPRPEPPALTVRPASYRGVRYGNVSFDSGYQPVLELPGTTRWLSTAANQTAHAYMLRHREPRPWIVQLHGFGMGGPSDVVAMRSLHFHRDLGLNVLQPVFPVHGPRSGGPNGEQALNLDFLNTVHAMSQAVREVRQLLSWIEETDGQPVAVHGVSMGAYLAALLAGLDDRIDTVITGVPTVDFAWVMRRHTPDEDRVLVDERGLFGQPAEDIHSVISPLKVQPLMPIERRFIYAGVADRMATPGQAYRLWEHWGQPPVLWYRGAHVSFAWSREVREFVDRSLRISGFDARGSNNRGSHRTPETKAAARRSRRAEETKGSKL